MADVRAGYERVPNVIRYRVRCPGYPHQPQSEFLSEPVDYHEALRLFDLWLRTCPIAHKHQLETCRVYESGRAIVDEVLRAAATG